MKITVDGVTRNMTADEKEIYEAGQALAAADAQELAEKIATKNAARQAVLDKLGLTADEAAALFG